MHYDYCVVAGRFPSTQSYFPHEFGYMMQNSNSTPVLPALTNWRLKDLSLIGGSFTEVVDVGESCPCVFAVVHIGALVRCLGLNEYADGVDWMLVFGKCTETRQR